MSRWDNPLRDLVSLQDRMNRLFEESLHRGGSGRRPDEDVRGALWQPTVDIFETEREIVLKAEVPGVERDEISVDVDQNRLTIRGERKFSDEVEREQYHRIERSYGAFARGFELPQTIDQESISAEYRHGVLTIRMPKRDETKSRQISISVG